jgi:single-strand DNA-binding protein
VCQFSIAVNRRGWNGAADTVSFWDCVAWEQLGEHIAESLSKGQRVIASGRIEQRNWQKEDGSKGTRWELTADAVGPDLRFTGVSVPERQARPQAPVLSEVPATSREAHPAGHYDDTPF